MITALDTLRVMNALPSKEQVRRDSQFSDASYAGLFDLEETISQIVAR